jgi:hypothetical protein
MHVEKSLNRILPRQIRRSAIYIILGRLKSAILLSSITYNLQFRMSSQTILQKIDTILKS